MKVKRVISALLVFCMLLTMFSTNFNYVLAAEDTGMADMDALAALGIDTSKVPEGYNENDTSNPYGKNTVTVNPVAELYMVGLEKNTSLLSNQSSVDPATSKSISNNLTGKIYGHNNNTSKSTKEIMQSNKILTIASGTTTASGIYAHISSGTQAGYYLQPDEYKVKTTLNSESTGDFKIASSKVASGNFDGNKEGKAVQNVLLYTGENSEQGGLYMRIGDAYTGDSHAGKYGSAIELIPETKSIGNPSGLITDVTENFATDPYLMQNYLQVATGDYDGDGTDEIAVYIPELGGSRIVVYKLKTTTGQSGKDYKKAGQWEVAWTYSLKETGYVSNMVSLVSGDFNKDGTADLAATWGYYYGAGNNKGSKAVIMFGANGNNMLKSSRQFDLTFDHPKYGISDIVRASFSLGDITGGGEELILGGQSDADIKNGNLNSRYVAIYTWNGTSFVSNISHNFDLFEKDKDGNLINGKMSINYGRYYSSPLCPANLAVIKQGLSEPSYLYLDSLQIQYGDKGLEIIAPLDQVGHNAGNTNYYVEYGAVSGDMTGLGYETLVTMQQTVSRTDNIGSYDSIYYFINWFYKLLNIKTYYMVPGESCLRFTPGKAYMSVLDFSSANPYSKRTEVDTSTSICMQNTDDDTSYMQYTGKHYFTYSDPKVLAVLASPPYFSDLLGRDDLSGNYGESTTSYSSTTGEGSGDTFNTTIEAGVYVSFEQSISIFGVEIASVEAEVAVTAGFTYETETTSSLEQTVSYSATSGEDMIAFFSIPLEIYEYTAYTSNGNGTYTKQAMTVNIPRTAAVQVLTLDSYENIAEDYDILPQISGTILSHTLGDPASYSSSESGYLKPKVYGGDWARVGYSGTEGGAGISQEIAMSKETTDSYNISGRIDTKAGAGAGGVKVGITVGAEVGGGWVNITTAGNSFSGELQNMPAEAEEYGYSHIWKIFSYLYDDGKVSFPVVNYLVKDVVAPPSLPTDFAQNVEKTTDSKIALTWTYDKMMAGFQIYRYYEFPDGSGSYELKFVPMADGIFKDGLYHFEFIDENLNPYQDYQYQIQTVRASVPNNSIPSEVLTVRTKTDAGYPKYSIEGLDIDGKLRIYPDSESTIKVIITNAEDYPDGISYQWQKNINGVWANINGRTTNELKFKSSGAADQATYRCRTNVIYFDEGRGNEYYISSYSPEFNTLYSKRTPLVLENSFKATPFKMDGGGNGLELNIDLVSSHTNHFDAPTGKVTFTVEGSDYDVDYTVELIKSKSPVSSGTHKDKYTSNATVDILNLPDGIYEISAYYGGSRVFKSLTTPENVTALIGASGYQLLLHKGDTQSVSYTYGDYITPVVRKVVNTADGIVSTTTSAGITYYLDNGTSELTLEDGKLNTPSVGTYTLKAKDNGNVLVEKEFTVSQRNITIKAQDKSDVGKGFVENPENRPKLELYSSTMAFDEKIEDLNLGIIAKNTAGTVITLNNSTEPGNYTITGSTTEATDPAVYNNYNVTFRPGVYTIIGQKYLVKVEAEKYQGRDVGTITLSNSSDSKDAEFSAGTQLMFFATPYTGYEVDSWNIQVTDTGMEVNIEPSQLNASKTRLSYTMKSEPITVTVKFKIAETRLTTAKIGEGTITWNDPSFTDGAIVKNGAQIDFKAVPAQGYTFKEWRIETGGTTSVRAGNPNSDGSNTLSFTMGSLFTTVRAVFERDSYTITLSDNLEAVYSYYDDFEGKDVEITVYSGSKITGDTPVLVRIRAGYTAAEDAVWTVNGQITDVPSAGYSFIIKDNTSVSVDTVQEKYTINTEADNGTITVKIGSDEPMVSDDEIKDVPGGSKVVFTAVPAHGYAFDGFEVEGTDKYTQNNNVLTINELGANITVTAIFAKSSDYTIEVNYGDRAAVNYVLYDPMGNEVRRDVANSGSSIEVSHGDRLTLTVTPHAGFMVDKWTIDGIVYDTNNKTRDLANIGKNMTVSVDVISQISYTVNYEAAGEGHIVSATSDGLPFVSGDIDVGGSSKVVIASAPDSGYMVEKWTINDKTVLNEDRVTFVGKTLTIESLASDKPTVDVKVYFTRHVEYTVEYNENTVEIQGEFTPDDASASNVREGAKAVFTVMPDKGCRVVDADINVDNFAVIKNSGDPDDQFGTWTLVIDKVENNLIVTASAMKIHSIIIDDVYGGEFGSTTETTYSEQAIAGEKVILHQYADLDRTFVEWDVYDEDDNPIDIAYIDGEFSFIMPDGDVFVSGEFEDISTVDIGIEVYDINSEAEGGYNGAFSAQIDRDGVSGYPEVFAVSTTAGAITGVNRGYSDEYVSWQASGLIITAEPDTDYRVLKWKVNGVTYTSPLDFPVQSDSINEFLMDVIDDENIHITVQFEQIGEKITYGIDGGNGKITSATNESTGNEFISGNTVSSPTTISFEASANAGYEAEAWLVDGEVVKYGNYSTFTYEADGIQGADIKVRFARVPFTVRYGGVNGNVFSEQVADGKTVRGDTLVTFTAEANPGYKFDRFSITGNSTAVSASNPMTLKITGNTNVTASFAPFANCVINYSVDGGNGTLSATKNGASFVSGSLGAGNDSIVLTAVPHPNYKVKNWVIDGKNVSASSTYTLEVGKSVHNVSVEFERSHYVLSFSAQGSGVVSAASGGNAIASGISLLKGSNAVFTAVPNPGFQVMVWKLNNSNAKGTQEKTTYTLNNINADTQVDAVFEPIPEYTVTIVKTGTGQGNVKAYVNGVENQIVNGTITVKNHDKVVLAAIPKDEYNNASWTVSGASANINETTATLADVTENAVATVRFGTAELITVEAYVRTEDGEPANGKMIVKAGYPDNLEPLNAVNTTVNVTKGKTVQFTAVPDEGYRVKYWVINDIVVYDYNNTIIRIPETNIKAEIYFEPAIYYRVPASSIGHTVAVTERVPDEPQYDKNLVMKGGKVKFTVTPDQGVYFKQLMISGVDCLTQTGSPAGTMENIVIVAKNNNNYTITVENVTKDIVYTIVTALPKVTIKDAENGAITATYTDASHSTVNVSSGDSVPAGTILTLNAVADSGYKFASWRDYAYGKSGSQIKLTVPYNDITISSTFAISSGGGGDTGGGGGAPAPAVYTIKATAGYGGSIAPKSATVELGGSQTFTITPIEGFVISDVLVNGQSIGAVSTYTFTDVDKDATIEAVFAQKLVSMKFNDVNDDDWFAKSVEYVVNLGLFKGTTEDTFSPYTSMTRGMFVTVLGRLYEYMNNHSLVQPEELSFMDVPLNMYYAPNVKWASDNNIISGYEDGQFKPDEPITREQIIAIMYRFAVYAGLDTTNTSDITIFTDSTDISPWAVEAVKWTTGSEIMTGRTDGSLDPQGLVLRCEVAAILHRFIINFIE